MHSSELALQPAQSVFCIFPCYSGLHFPCISSARFPRHPCFDAASVSAALHEWIAATVQAAIENLAQMEARLPPSLTELHVCQLFEFTMHNTIRRCPLELWHLKLLEVGNRKIPLGFRESDVRLTSDLNSDVFQFWTVTYLHLAGSHTFVACCICIFIMKE